MSITRADLDNLSIAWAKLMTVAYDIHIRDGHSGELFTDCPWPMCKMAMDAGNVILKETLRLNNIPAKPFLVKKAI